MEKKTSEKDTGEKDTGERTERTVNLQSIAEAQGVKSGGITLKKSARRVVKDRRNRGSSIQFRKDGVGRFNRIYILKAIFLGFLIIFFISADFFGETEKKGFYYAYAVKDASAEDRILSVYLGYKNDSDKNIVITRIETPVAWYVYFQKAAIFHIKRRGNDLFKEFLEKPLNEEASDSDFMAEAEKNSVNQDFQDVQRFNIQPRQNFQMRPGQYRVLLKDVNSALKEGVEFPMTIYFLSGKVNEISVQVVDALPELE